MIIKYTKGQQPIIVLEEGDSVKLTIAGEEGKTCINLEMQGRGIAVTGGASLIDEIVGDGMAEKVRQ